LDWLTGRDRTSLSTTILQRTPADISGRKYGCHYNLYQTALQRHNPENAKQIFPEKNCAASVPISTFMFL
jgi:hypothetical protein